MAEHTYGPEKMREMAGLLRNPPVQFTEDWLEDLQLSVLIGAMRNGAEVLDCAATDQDSLLRVVKAAMEGYCRACGGTGRRSMPCSDPQCGDSTWEHYCDATTEECSACAPLRAAIAALPPHLVARLSELAEGAA